jgi:hypothetical protein
MSDPTTAVEQELDTEGDLLRSLASATVLPTLKPDTMPPIRVKWLRRFLPDGQPDWATWEMNDAYPFTTIEEIKQALMVHILQSGVSTTQAAQWISKFVFLGVPLGSDTVPGAKTRYIPADYLWFPPGEKLTRRTIDLQSPIVAAPDRRFVDAQGNALPLGQDLNRGRLTVESAFLIPRDGNMPTLHAFSLSVLLSQYTGQKPISEIEWNGRYRPYFPYIQIDEPMQPTTKDIESVERIKSYILKKSEEIRQLDEILVGGEPLYKIRVNGYHQLRLSWPVKESGFEGCESLFYRLNVTSTMPFIRLIPSDGAPIVKIHTKGVLPIPDLADPRLISRWASEVPPIPGQDYLFIKVLIRPQFGGIMPMYATIRIFNDGSADALVYPPRGGAILDPVADIAGRLMPAIKESIAGTHLDKYVPTIGEVSIHATLRVSADDRLMDGDRLKKRIAAEFAPIFQYIPSLPGSKALATIRYKLVDQFAAEDKIFTFLTLAATLQSAQGELLREKLVEDVINEFNVSYNYAVSKVIEWDQNNAKYTVVAPETGVFVEAYNPGIDIVINPGALKSYSIDIYRVDSVETLERVYTMLTLLLRSSEELFDEDVQEGEVFEAESAKIQEEIIERQESVAAAAAATAAPDIYEPDFMADGITDFNIQFGEDEYEDEAPVAVPVPVPVVQKDQAAPAAPAAKALPAPPIKGEEPEGVLADTWFISRLKKYDRRLFDYVPTVNKKYTYPRRCAANDDRQPAVLSQEEFDTMMTIYENDTDMAFIVYPIKNPADAEPPIGIDEVITVLKFGSDPSNPNYYICPPLFCLRDNIVVREKDFTSTTDRKGKSKPANTCPFCYGKEITGTQRKKAVKGYTVIRRKNKPKVDKQHKYIGFLASSEHPDNFKVPCCYVKEEVLHYSDPAFQHFREYEHAAEARIAGVEEVKEEIIPESLTRAVEYSILLQRIYKENILKFAKHPIPAARIGLLPPGLDSYFQQNSTNLVDRIIQQTLVPNAKGFLRLGVDNSNQNESLLCALSPLMFKNTVDEVRAVLLRSFTPHVFINSHYGNLVHEFFSPADEEPAIEDLRQFASVYLNADVNDKNRFALSRLYRAYDRFLNFLEDPTQKKELRHISPILAEPGVIFPRGLTLIVLNIDPAKPDELPIVRCPPYGASDRHITTDVAYLTCDRAGNYEVMVYTDNRQASGTVPVTHDTYKEFQHAARPSWPQIVVKRVDEFFKACKSTGYGAYTSQSGINQLSMIPLAKAIATMNTYPAGCVRDIYNHIAALTFRSKPGKNTLVALPVIDDGSMPITLRIHFDWDDYTPAPVEEVIDFYRRNIDTTFSFYPGYKTKYIVRDEIEDKIVAVQLENGIFVPAGPPKDPTAISGMKIINIKEMEWQQNKMIARPSGPDPSLSSSSTKGQLEELYQHFRLSVAAWISSSSAGPSTRKAVEDIIFRKDLPVYEKRKRLEILIGSTLRSWMLSGDDVEIPPTLIRRDCVSITDAQTCNGVGACKWASENGKCMLHVPGDVELGSVKVATGDLFVGRVIDELINFYDRRRQLMTNNVSHLAAISGAFRIGNQYIVPQGSPAWTQMLQMDWSIATTGVRFYEELSSEGSVQEVAGLVELPEDITVSGLRMWRAPINESQPLLPLMPLLNMSYSDIGLAANAPIITPDAADAYVRNKKSPIIIVYDDSIIARRPASGVYSTVPIIYHRDEQVALIVTQNMHVAVPVNSLTGKLADAWANAVIPGPVAVAGPVAPVAMPVKKPLRVLRRIPQNVEIISSDVPGPGPGSVPLPQPLTRADLLKKIQSKRTTT